MEMEWLMPREKGLLSSPILTFSINPFFPSGTILDGVNLLYSGKNVSI